MIEYYSKYKDSKYLWFGTIPFHWKLVALKNVLSKVYGGGTPSTSNPNFWADDDNGIPWVAISDITKSNGVLIETSKKITFLGKLDKGLELIPKGTLLMSIFASLGKTTRLGIDATINQAILGLETKDELKLDYLEYLLVDAERYVTYYSSANTQENLNLTKIKNLIFPIPPVEEQNNIIRFLDHQTIIIDEIIQRKEKQIELLKEKRQSIINEVVTKGLNPNAKMKNSGVEWLGEIPEDWKCIKMKHSCEFIFDGTHGSFVRVDSGYRLLSVRNIVNGVFTFRDDDSCISKEDYLQISSKFKIQENDIQLAIVGATLGKVAIVEKMDEEFVTQRSLATIRTNSSKCLSRFLYYYMRSDAFQSYLWMSTNFSAQPGVYLGTIQNSNFPLPDIKEQKDIISYLDSRISKIESMEGTISTQNEKLKEYRQSLISEAVTGKIDVKDWEPINKTA